MQRLPLGMMRALTGKTSYALIRSPGLAGKGGGGDGS
jgi:hypothetical protein